MVVDVAVVVEVEVVVVMVDVVLDVEVVVGFDWACGRGVKRETIFGLEVEGDATIRGINHLIQRQ